MDRKEKKMSEKGLDALKLLSFSRLSGENDQLKSEVRWLRTIVERHIQDAKFSVEATE